MDAGGALAAEFPAKFRGIGFYYVEITSMNGEMEPSTKTPPNHPKQPDWLNFSIQSLNFARMQF